jgi:trk system potassium uptake protein TrkA
LKGADIGIVRTGDDITASLLSTRALRDLGIREIYEKVISSDRTRVIEKMGVSETIFPERESGNRLDTRASARGLLNYVRPGAEFRVQEVAVNHRKVQIRCGIRRRLPSRPANRR